VRHAAVRPLRPLPFPPHRAASHAPGASLGLTVVRTAALIAQIEQGLRFTALESLAAASGMSAPELATAAGIPQRTLARRKAAGRLSPNESEKLLRVSTIFEKAVGLFAGNASSAVAWLLRPNRALGNHTPLEYSRTELGAREVENLIGRLEHGIFS
jgi:putative toxin-antitoxin system antitoxin component (TIGR02293 family)